MPRQDTVDFLTAFAVGTVLGIGATLLLQPEETRREKVVRKLKPYRKQMEKSYGKLAKNVRARTDATSDLTADVIGAGRELLSDFREEVSEILEQARAELKDLVEEHASSLSKTARKTRRRVGL